MAYVLSYKNAKKAPLVKKKRGNDVLCFLSFRELLFLFSVGDCVGRGTWYSIAFAVSSVPPARFVWLAEMAFL
jgi:hypothetical protein